MAKQKQPKMKPAEAVQVLANELNQSKGIINQMGQDLMQARAFLQEVGKVLENYIVFKDDQDAFTKHMENLISKAKKESEDDSKRDEHADGQDTDGDKVDEGIGAEGVRA